MSETTMNPITADARPYRDFNTATGQQSPFEMADKKGIPMVKQAFGKAVNAVGDFAENNPEIAKWTAFGLAALATPAMFNIITNPKTTLWNAGKLALKVGAVLAVGNVFATWAANPEGGFTGALAKTSSDIGALLGFDGKELEPPVIDESGPAADAAAAGAKIGSVEDPAAAGTSTDAEPQPAPQQAQNIDAYKWNPGTTGF